MLVYYADWENYPNYVTVCQKARVQSTGHYDYTCYDPELVNDAVTNTDLIYPISIQPGIVHSIISIVAGNRYQSETYIPIGNRYQLAMGTNRHKSYQSKL